MLDTVNKIYCAQELPGEFLVQPLKQYHGFFAQKIEKSSGLWRAVSAITHLVTGLFAYPLFGLLAGAGILVKLTGVRCVAGHNSGKKGEVEGFIGKLKQQETFARTSLLEPSPVGWKKTPIREYLLTPQNADSMKEEILSEIDVQTSRFQKIYYDATGIISKREGSIAFSLQVMERE